MADLDWAARWRENRIGFHQADVNPILTKNIEVFGPPSDAGVLVPLCGKSVDMAFLAERGHQVVGVELVELGARAFFEEQNLTVTEPPASEGFKHLQHKNISVYVGDFFEAPKLGLPKLPLVFDRAAFIAIDPEQRQKYFQTLLDLTTADATMLIATVDYDTNIMSPPPFAFHGKDLEALVEGHGKLERVHSEDRIELEPKFKKHGLEAFYEETWVFKRGA